MYGPTRVCANIQSQLFYVATYQTLSHSILSMKIIIKNHFELHIHVMYMGRDQWSTVSSG